MFYYKNPVCNLEELHNKMMIVYDEYPGDKIEKLFVTLQMCMNEILYDEGGSNYCLPHMSTTKEWGPMPIHLEVSRSAARMEQKDNNYRNIPEERIIADKQDIAEERIIAVKQEI